MAFTLKPNPIYDFYQEEYPVKFSAMNPKPLACILQASQQRLGTRIRWQDARVEEYVAQCKSAGIKYGLYHFLTPNGIAEQAALFVGVWRKVGGADVAPVVDVEVDLVKYYPHPDKRGETTIGRDVWQGHVKLFLDLVAAGTGRTPIIYTNENYWKFVCPAVGILKTITPPSWTANYPLWVAQYPAQPDAATKPAALPLGWKDWAIWQYNDKGKTNGFQANDLNTCSAAFAAELGAVIVPPDPDPEPEPIESPFVFATITRADGTKKEFNLVNKA